MLSEYKLRNGKRRCYYIFYSAVLSDRQHFFFSNTSGIVLLSQKMGSESSKTIFIKTEKLVFNSEENEIFNGNSMELIPKIDTD
ncbi:hypothetical protein ATZ36_14715 [Candidatus Endomicrobiellum trichonymphae]|uniref:Uncharacterized protein n=1 Tax=Endomicrobium trichonymphae TaxID=1408204 RepID=A0A1E5ILK6_ENDTX|nr:hypothetical protein ATZ36_14715 [Candidatus Endomicrobium trichonymphae]